MKITHVAFLVLSIVAVSLAAKLADSGYPTSGMNPQRNWKSNRPLSCPDVAKGKTTILEPAWTWDAQAAGFSFSSNRDMTVDEKGFMFIVGPFPELPVMARLHTNGTFFPTPTYEPSSADSIPTHVQGGEMYFGGRGDSARVNSNTFAEIASFNDEVVGEQSVSSYVPFGANLMVKTNIGSSNDANALTYFSIVSNLETSGQNFLVGTPHGDVMIYNNTQGVESAIAFGDSGQGPWVIGSTAWSSRNVDHAILSAFVSGNELILNVDTAPNYPGAIYRYNAANGQLIATHNFTTPGASIVVPTNNLYYNGKSLICFTYGESSYFFSDFINGATYYSSLSSYTDLAHPIISADDILLLPLVSLGGNFEFHGFDWNTRERKLHGRIPMAYSNFGAGTPVISENCNVIINVGNYVYALKPMPLKNVAPIFECVDADGFGYFSYNNREQNPIWVPRTVDRNNFNNSEEFLYEEFSVGRGPRFPLSQKANIGKTGTVTWILEDYTLTVALNANLACPTTISLVVVLTSPSPFPNGFNEVVRLTFAQVNGISEDRVSIVAKKRNVAQISTLETELAIAPDGTSTEPTPQQVVQNFVTEQVQQQFVASVSNATDAPEGIEAGLTGKSVSTEIEGIPAPPVAVPKASEPVAAPTKAPTAVPVATTSAAAVLQASLMLFVWALLANVIIFR